jgi:hypothetical protein
MTTTASSPLSERMAALELEQEISCLTGLPGHVVQAVIIGFDTSPETSERVWQAVQGLEAAQELAADGINSEYCWVHPFPNGGWTCQLCRKEEEGQKR